MELDDKPLVVLCDYNSLKKKVAFKSARACTYEVLSQRVELGFSLQPGYYEIKWTHDDHGPICISSDTDMKEAIEYHQGATVGPSASSSSIFSSRSSRSKIVLQVTIVGEYDGPSLSDTGSITSREEYEDSNESEFSLEGYVPPPPDDDAVTVSSKDTGRHAVRPPKSESLIRKIFDHSARGSATSRLRQSRSQQFHSSSLQARNGLYTEDAAGSSSDLGSDLMPSIPPTAVFERLKLEEQEPSEPLSHKESMVAWLDGQGGHYPFSGPVPASMRPPTDADTLSLNADFPLSDSVSESEAVGVVLQVAGGKPQYVLSRQSSEYDADDSSTGLHSGSNHRPFSMTTFTTDSSAQRSTEYPSSSETPSYRRSLVHSLTDPLPHPTHQSDVFKIPPELLLPEEVTDCSECGNILSSLKYTCTICGEKAAVPRTQLEEAHANAKGKGKGKGREFDEPTIYGGEYPPRAHRSPVTSLSSFSSYTYVSPHQKPLPALPSSSPTDTIIGSGSSSYTHPRSNSSSSSGTLAPGYELCWDCFQCVGVYHTTVGVRGPGLALHQMDSPTSPQELALARRTAPRQKGQLRHAFSERYWGSNGWQDVEHDAQALKCSGCQSTLATHRYKCGVCADDYTICRACFSDVHYIHPLHAFIQMPDKPSRPRSVPDMMPDESDSSKAFDAADEPSLKHPGVRCYHCKQDIVGARFRCVDCTTREVDICSNCETAGLPGNLDSNDGDHNSSHIMLKIPMPLNMNDVQSASQRAYGLRNGRDRAHIVAMTRSSPSSVSSGVQRTETGAGTDEEDSHLMFCNSCGEDIIGDRYQCLNCPSKPSSFNLCAKCEKKSYQVHDARHLFIKLRRPVDVNGPLESEFPIVPLLYSAPAGPTRGSASSNANPEAYLTDLTHTFALCDRDMSRINGKWFRCAYCAKDLCSECEELDTHDDTHVFLVFKAPVDMQSFRHFAALDNPHGSPPVLHGPIYYD